MRATSRCPDTSSACNQTVPFSSPVTMPVTLNRFPPLPNPQKALLALEEFGILYEIQTVSVVAAQGT